MSGSQETATSFRNRRHPMNTKGVTSVSPIIRTFWVLLLVLVCVLDPVAVRGQAAAQGPAKITLDQAIQLALQQNHSLLANRTNVQQNLAQEVTANLRPNPTLFADWAYLPLATPPGGWSTYLHDLTEADAGLSYTIERGGKRA